MKRIIPIIKITFLIVSTLTILSLKNYLVLTGILFFLLLAFMLISPKLSVFNRLKMFIPLGFFILILQIVFNQRQSLFYGFLSTYIIWVRLVTISLVIFYFMAITSPLEIILAFWFFPQKIKLLLTMTFYFIPIIFQESEQIILIQKSRGLKNFFWNITPLIIPLLHRVFIRAELLALTIISRSYQE